MTTERNPNDLTLRNVRSANKKFAELTARVKAVEKALRDVWFAGAQLSQLEVRLQRLEHHAKAGKHHK